MLRLENVDVEALLIKKPHREDIHLQTLQGLTSCGEYLVWLHDLQVTPHSRAPSCTLPGGVSVNLVPTQTDNVWHPARVETCVSMCGCNHLTCKQ